MRRSLYHFLIHFIPQITKVTELNTDIFNIVTIEERINAKFVKLKKIQFGNEGTKIENEKEKGLHINGETTQRVQVIFPTYFQLKSVLLLVCT